MVSAATRKEGEDREARSGMTTEAAPTVLVNQARLGLLFPPSLVLV
jgi:TRAP-type C4-dicarboxylate transport system permease large subunit